MNAYAVISSDGHESQCDDARAASLAVLEQLAAGAEFVAAVPLSASLPVPVSDPTLRESLARPWRAERLARELSAGRTVPEIA